MGILQAKIVTVRTAPVAFMPITMNVSFKKIAFPTQNSTSLVQRFRTTVDECIFSKYGDKIRLLSDSYRWKYLQGKF